MSKSLEEVRAELRSNGETIPSWAKKNGFPVPAVRAVIYGHNKGNYGQSHSIAVALGIKKVTA